MVRLGIEKRKGNLPTELTLVRASTVASGMLMNAYSPTLCILGMIKQMTLVM